MHLSPGRHAVGAVDRVDRMFGSVIGAGSRSGSEI